MDRNDSYRNVKQTTSTYGDPPLKDGLTSVDFKFYIEEGGEKVRRYKCSICEKIMACPKAILAHYRAHIGLKPYKERERYLKS